MKNHLDEKEQKRMVKEIDEELNNEQRFYDSGKISPFLLAKEIMEQKIFITLFDTEEIYYYEKGIYKTKAEKLIKKKVQELTNTKTTKHRVQEVIGHVQRSTYLEREELNKHKHLIHLENGIYNLATNELEEFTPEIFSTVKLPLKYDKKADCPAFKKFVSEVVKEKDIPIIQEMIGYCLLRNTIYQKAFMFLGEGSNGKSTLLDAITFFLGCDNVSNKGLQELTGNRFSIVKLYGMLANVFPDLPSTALHRTGIFKALVTGDRLDAEKKFKESFSFSNTAKLLFSANKLPETTDDTNAFYRRWVFFKFPYTFEGKKKNPKKLREITTPKELSGLFNWAIEGLKRLHEKGEFTDDKSTEELREEYINLSDSLKAFILERIEFDGTSEITKPTFYQYYKMYCDDNNLTVKSKSKVGREVPAHIPAKAERTYDDTGKLVRCWKGIKFKIIEEKGEKST